VLKIEKSAKQKISNMINSVDELKKERPDLVDLFEGLSKEDLINQCYLESIDAINMEERVQLFMNECTLNMSKTNYTLDSIRLLISQKKDYDTKEFCKDLLEESDFKTDITETIKNYLD